MKNIMIGPILYKAFTMAIGTTVTEVIMMMNVMEPIRVRKIRVLKTLPSLILAS